MVQDETTSPGYCFLQVLRDDAPLPAQNVQSEHCTRDNKCRILLKHSVFFNMFNAERAGIRRGPAHAQEGVPGQIDIDSVPALHCPSWPKEAAPWLQQQYMSGWPTKDMKRYAAEHGCFVVAVASRQSPYQNTEWRISTSYAERCLMFKLNMTQIRCYILMKMILKTFFKPHCGDAVSSFMCKNVLFHCIADSSASKWCDSNLIACLNRCLDVLCNCIRTENCPHFIIPRNNLLAGKLSIHVKEKLVEIICNLTRNIEQSLLGISLDQLGKRLTVKSGGRMLAGHLLFPEFIAGKVVLTLILNIAKVRKVTQNLIHGVIYHTNSVSVYERLVQVISTLWQIYSVGNKIEQLACRYYTPLFCATLGSIAASIDIYHSQKISPLAKMWFSAGLNTDLSSSRLKLASALFCAGHNQQSEIILANLSSCLELTPVLSFCFCYNKGNKIIYDVFAKLCNEKTAEDVIKQNIACCVTFLPFLHFYCVPKKLRYEFFRSTAEDRAYRGAQDFWMDWAAVDSRTYLHFMEYKVSAELNRPIEQHRALNNLLKTIYAVLGNLSHTETALNLLGQCYEHENKVYAALWCYMRSLEVRRRNNAAKWQRQSDGNQECGHGET